MTAQGRPQAAAAPSLPGVDDATAPFSSLFDSKNGFDLRTVESTAQLADRSFFVTSNGRRYRVESIPDGNAPHAALPGQPPAHSAPTTPVSSPSPPESRPSATQTFGSLIRNSLRRRPASNASSHYPTSPRTGRASCVPQATSPISPEPKSPTHEVTNMMSQLNVNRFSATPLYWQSDGGVQAAEALTDPSAGPKASSSNPSSPVSPSAQPTAHPPPAAIYGLQPSPDPNIPPHVAGLSGHIANFDYVNYTEQANYHVQQSRQLATSATGGLPSLLEFSSPMPSPRRDSEFYSPIDAPPYYDPEKEYLGIHTTTDRPPASSSSSSALQIPLQAGPQANYVNIGRSYSSGELYDTLTPVVVYPGPEISHAPSYSSDGASTSRDNVLPGEMILFDRPVKSAQTLNSPVFQDGQLKVFRNTLSNDLRFHCKVGHESETYWIKGVNAHLVPVYAYDPRFPNVIYIRDNESEKGNVYLQSAPGNGRPSGIYQFNRLKDLCDFQAKLTSEKVVLDITSVKLVKLSKDSRSSDTYYTVRLQIWHEAELRRSTQSDVASFVTAGTALSGPLRERLVASSSRLIVYLGRLGEYITLFITDDIELKAEGQTMVKLKARKAGSAFSKKGSRWPGIKAHIERKGNFEMAGLDIHGQATNPDIDATYDLYKTFEIDFENSPSQDNFIRKWDEVMRERRQQRVRLNQIREEMGQNVFSGPIAREIW